MSEMMETTSVVMVTMIDMSDKDLMTEMQDMILMLEIVTFIDKAIKDMINPGKGPRIKDTKDLMTEDPKIMIAMWRPTTNLTPLGVM